MKKNIRSSVDFFDNYLFEQCVDEYTEALDDEVSEIESYVNLTCLWLFVGCISITSSEFLLSDNVALSQLRKKNEKVNSELNRLEMSEIRDYLKEMKELYFDKEIDKEFQEMLVKIKKSKWSDLADYFTALRYILCLKESDLQLEKSIKLGYELMFEFNTMGNKYAKRYLALVRKVHSS